MPIAVTASPGVPVEVRLERYATAGYRWEVVDKPAAVAISDASAAPATASAPGAPGQQVFRFVADLPGVYVIRLSSRRPWESKPDRTEVVTMTVTPP
ncbi:MAG: protease inhibitor I42 family protein [Sandarakinorhabdus sp.]|nr:protease inhibitor I42 family protein [Sandarakinorhabdus sp.]